MSTTNFPSAPSWRRALLGAAILALALAPGCKKDADSTPPDDESGLDDDAGGGEPDAADADDAEPTEAALDPSTFEETVNDNMDDVGECFGTANAANPELKGTIDTMFTVGPDGKVSEFKVNESSSLNDEGLNACITEKVKGWQFPKPASGEPTTLPFPFNLEPG
ncbi:MAG: AgmX/PglI C-terminal domain-containing protein [Myxococcales bacterium]|nr:AgmX/PglI C-terminal domain-containing protein [Myxococcales bacterium]MCB9750501.1 AgmX/PglI C-terminal domain-containing protein [Myxococcales bacterium]